MIGILDLQIGNLKSVFNAVYQSGEDPVVLSEPDQISGCDRLIMPGVGSFQRAMENLQSLAMREPVDAFRRSGKPMLGLCVGMQIMAQGGSEGGRELPGLGWINGYVRRFPDLPGHPVPHVGWNDLQLHAQHPVLKGVRDRADFYFVHSYRYEGCAEAQVIGTTEYGSHFPAVVAHENVVGFQFHPEKSQASGLKLIENFCSW